MLSRYLPVAVILCVSLPAASPNLLRAAAKDDAKAVSEKPKPKAKSDEKKSETRLPPYYRDVVTDEQRKEAAGVCSKFNTKIAKLRAEINSLADERDRALDALLSKDQKEKLAQLKSNAKGKRAKSDAN